MTQLDHMGRTVSDRLPPLPPETTRAAARTVARLARDRDDARQLLDVLGLLEEDS